MMRSTLEERCTRELEHFVAKVRACKFDYTGQVNLKVPWTHYSAFSKRGLIYQIGTALRARVWFSKHGPEWAQELPLGCEIPPLLRGSGPRGLLGHYAMSLEMLSYDYLTHPQLYEFCRGVMAHPDCPDVLKDDPELLKEFPPKELPGLGGRLVWFSQAGERLAV